MNPVEIGQATAGRREAAPIGLIGGIGLTEVRVYTQRRAPDGRFSGCPHVHGVTDEGYFVLQGTGAVEFHDLEHGFRTLRLEPGDYVHFPPLVMHRLISDGGLVILGMMGNAGLAEGGDARIYFGPEADQDAKAFDRLVSLPRREGLEGALKRRDAAVEGYQHLLRLWEDDREGYFAELRRFFDRHCAAIAAEAESFDAKVRSGPMSWAEATRRRLAALPDRPDVPAEVKANRRGSESALGMCGTLRPILSLSDAFARSAER